MSNDKIVIKIEEEMGVADWENRFIYEGQMLYHLGFEKINGEWYHVVSTVSPQENPDDMKMFLPTSDTKAFELEEKKVNG